MGTNVFGTPITDETLKGLPKYHDKQSITSKDRAEVALLMKNSEAKDMNARQFLDRIAAGHDYRITTRVFIYNATGNRVWLFDPSYRDGGAQQSTYPIMIENGQWGALFYGKWSSNAAAVINGGVVYVGENPNGVNRHFIIGWETRDNAYNKCYADIRPPQNYDTNAWNAIYNTLSSNSTWKKYERDQCALWVEICDHPYHSVTEAIMTLTD